MSISSRLALAAVCGAAAVAMASPAQAQMYWRLDTGFSMANDADFKDKNFAADQIVCADAACTTAGQLNDVGESVILGGGIGYRFNPNLRGDVTLQLRNGYELSGTDGSPATFKAGLESMAVFATGYYDFGAPGGVRPYVGVGIGWVQNKLDDVAVTFAGGSATLPGGKKNNTGFALLAGATIPVGGWNLEVGYRYVDLGKFEAPQGNIMAAGVGFPYSGAGGELTAHEITVGFRF